MKCQHTHCPQRCTGECRKATLGFAGMIVLVFVLAIFSSVMCGINQAHGAEPQQPDQAKPKYWIDVECRNGMMFVVIVSETGDVDIEADMQPKSGMVPVKAVWCDPETGEVTD